MGYGHRDPLSRITAPDGSPCSALERTELVERLLGGLAGLKPAYRRVIMLSFFHGLSLQQVAAQFGISRAAASMLLFRAVKTLRHNLANLAIAGPLQGI